MSKETKQINKKTLVNLMLALLVFFLIINALVFSQQRELLLSEHTKFVNNSISFFSKLTTTALLKNDYANIEQSINQWGEDDNHITKISLTSKNGFIIAQYSNEQFTEHLANFSHELHYSDENHALLNVTVSQEDIHQKLIAIAFKLITGSILLVVLFGAILWRILLNSAIKPLNNEITLHEITSRQLHEAKLIAETANQSKSEFLANMSHEIRTPMNGVLGMLSLLLDTNLTDKQKDFARTAYNSGDSLLIVLNDILDFSKIEAGKLNIEITSFDPYELIEETVSLMAGPAQSKGLELASEINPDTPYRLRGDSGRIRQILTNLISNAIKFTEHGDVVITAETKQNKDTCQLTINVKDTGIGINKAKLNTIFNAFEQADTSTTRIYGGTGLGLSISKKLCQLMRGNLTVNSSLDTGSTFSFSLPLQKDTSSIKDITPISLESLNGKRTLIVDDNKTNRKILEHTLQNWQMDFQSANSAKKALPMIASAHQNNAPYQIIITDLMMPGINGIEFIELVKSDPRNNKITPVLLSSIQTENESNPITIDKDLFHSILTKPVKPSLLLKTLLSITSSTSLQEPTKPQKDSHPFHKYTAILAEDNVTNQRVAQGMLKKLGFTLTTVHNGIELLSELEKSTPDLIFMDCHMPEMDGYETTKAIRESKSPYKDIVIIAMTANAMKEDHGKCLLAGMNDYIAKPLRYETILSVASKWLEPINEEHNIDDNTGLVDINLLDLNMVESLKSILDEAYPDIVAEFFHTSKAMLKEILLQTDTLGTSLLIKKIHTLKGSSANIGAIQLSFAFRLIEQNLRHNPKLKLDTPFQNVFNLLEQSEQAFKEVL